MGRSGLGGSEEAAIVLVTVVLVVLLLECGCWAIGRLSTPAIRELYAACKRMFVSACGMQQSHRELLSTRKHPP